nr:reverse transcriptase domain-containing protein [Tanacetum cinerariifolium]
SSGLRRFFRYAMFIYSFYLCYSLSLYPFTERYAQPYFFSCPIRQRGVTNPVKEILLKSNLPDHKSILTDLQVPLTKHGRMTKLYSSYSFIANRFNAGYLKMEVKAELPVTEWTVESVKLIYMQHTLRLEWAFLFGNSRGRYDAWRATSVNATSFGYEKIKSIRPKGHCVFVHVTIEDPDDGFKPTGVKDSGGGHWKSRSKKKKSNEEEDDLSQPWGEVATSNHERKKSFLPWKQQEGNHKQNFKKGGFRNQPRPKRKQDQFTILMKTPKEIFTLDKGKLKAPPPMTILVEKRNDAKFYEFHGEVGHNTDECMHLKKQIEEMLKAGKLSHLIKELKQNNGERNSQRRKKGETFGKNKALGTEGSMIIEAEIKGHCIHRVYVDGGSASEILYKHFFSRLCLEIKNQLVSATTPLIGFSGEIIWPIGKIKLLVKIGDEEHSTSTWMNFVVVRSPSPHNGIIGRLRFRKLQAVPSTAHEMLKFLVEGGVITLKSSRMISPECAIVSGSKGNLPIAKQIVEERIKVAINLKYTEQTIMIGSTLIKEGRNKLCDLLQRNLDIFAWKPADMTGVPRHIEEYRLNVREGCSSVRQKKNGQADDRNHEI